MHKLFGFLSFIFLLGLAPISSAQTVAQASPNPIILTPGTTIDDLQVLMATAAERTATATVPDFGPNKNPYVVFSGNDQLQWSIKTPAAATYHVFALIKADPGQSFELINTSNAATLSFSVADGWNKLDVGTMLLPDGTSALKLMRAGKHSGEVQVKSLELIRESDYPNYLSRVASSRVDTTWLSQSKYGLFFQYGSWGFPNNVGSHKSVDQQAHDFNVPAFVQMVQSTGANYVIWSFSWWGYKPDMPVPAIDAIMGDGSYTAERNLIAEIAIALKAKGIRFVLYYHTGTEESDWWAKQDIPATFPTRGTGDRSMFFNSWSAVIRDIGNALGTNLDGYFFDDGMIYYPARFEELATIARTGNPDRFISWNSWVMPRFTDFQDVAFGENEQGELQAGSSLVGGNGIYASGPHSGLLQHGMFTLEKWDDWGVHLQNKKIAAVQKHSDSTLLEWIDSASSRGVTLSLNISMYEDGTITDAALSQLYALRNHVYGTSVTAPRWTTYNNDWANITYAGAWALSGGRNAGDYGDDVRWTAADGDSATITFSGTGITVFGPMSNGDGLAQVTLDGVNVSTLSAAFSGDYSPQQHLIRFAHLSNGPHTLKITKSGGTYLQLDKISIASP